MHVTQPSRLWTLLLILSSACKEITVTGPQNPDNEFGQTSSNSSEDDSNSSTATSTSNSSLASSASSESSSEDPMPPHQPGTLQSISSWRSLPLPAHAKNFNLSFTMFAPANALDAVTGLSENEAAQYSDLSVALRFFTNNKIEAFNNGYTSYESLNYSPNRYFVEISVNADTQKYSMLVSTEDGVSVLVANRFSFRRAAQSLNFINVISENSVHTVSDLNVSSFNDLGEDIILSSSSSSVSSSSSSVSSSSSTSSVISNDFIPARGEPYSLPLNSSNHAVYQYGNQRINFAHHKMNTTIAQMFVGDQTYNNSNPLYWGPVNIDYGNHLISNVYIDGKNATDGKDLVEIKPFHTPIGNIVFKNVVIKDATIINPASHTDLIQTIISYTGSSSTNINHTGWFIMQDTVIKNSVHNSMIIDHGSMKGTLYQNLWVDHARDKGKPNSWIAMECARLINLGWMNHCYGNNRVVAGGPWGQPAEPQMTWLVNVRSPVDGGRAVSVLTKNGSTDKNDWGPIIIVESNPVLRNEMYIDGDLAFENGTWNRAKPIIRRTEADKVYRFADIESALARFPQLRPPMIETSCSGWRTPPAGCIQGAGPMGSNEW